MVLVLKFFILIIVKALQVLLNTLVPALPLALYLNQGEAKNSLKPSSVLCEA